MNKSNYRIVSKSADFTSQNTEVEAATMADALNTSGIPDNLITKCFWLGAVETPKETPKEATQEAT